MEWTVVLSGVAKFASASVPGPKVDLRAKVTAVRKVSTGKPSAGLHVDAKIEGGTINVFIAPANLFDIGEMDLRKGDEIRVIGTRTGPDVAEVVLARQTVAAFYDDEPEVFVTELMVNLGNDCALFSTEEVRCLPFSLVACA